MRTLGLQMINEGLMLTRAGYRILLAGGAEENLTWSNFNAELITAANANGHNDNDTEFNAFVDYIFFDAAAFNLADGAALDTALTNETMSIADLTTYAAAYTP
jgi:hypothetical protein|tara:strand:- start:203 stop:511 length:309 start_codon:yes stop_codon:yes gene_type:complete